MCRPSGALSPEATSSSPTTTWMTTSAWATRSSGQKTIEARASPRSHATDPHAPAAALATRTPIPMAMWNPLSGCPSALCSCLAQASVIPPAWSAEELSARPCIPGAGDRCRHRLHARKSRARAKPPGPGEKRAVRVRPALRRQEELPLRDQLLPDRDALHPVRHRSGLPLPGGAAARGVRLVRARGDGGLHLPAPRCARVRLAKGCPGMEVTRTRMDDMRVRQLRAQQMLRGELAGRDLEEFVEERLLLDRKSTRL